ELIHASVELVVREGDGVLAFGFAHEDDRRLVAVLGEVPVDAVVGGVELPPREPLVERGVARVERLGPVLVPGQHVAELPEALREVLERKPLVYRGVGQVGLADELRLGDEPLLFLPVHCDLGFGQFTRVFLRRSFWGRGCHRVASRGRPYPCIYSFVAGPPGESERAIFDGENHTSPRDSSPLSREIAPVESLIAPRAMGVPSELHAGNGSYDRAAREDGSSED